MPSAGSSRADALPAELACHRAELRRQPRDTPLVAVQDAGDLLAEGLHPAVQCRAVHPADPHVDQDAAAADGNVRRRPLVVLVHAGRSGAAPRAPHRSVLGPRPHADHVARVLHILDDQGRQPRKHSSHKLCHVNHGRS